MTTRSSTSCGGCTRAPTDAHARRIVAASGLDSAAREDLDILRWFPSPRDWWRLGFTPAGELVGLTVPARNYSDPIVGLVGVVPDHCGRGYGYDLLVECTHLLVEQGADRVVAATDVANTPMAAAFTRAGYPVVQECLFHDYRPPSKVVTPPRWGRRTRPPPPLPGAGVRRLER